MSLAYHPEERVDLHSEIGKESYQQEDRIDGGRQHESDELASPSLISCA